MISVHVSSLQLNHIESVTSQLLWLIKLQVVSTGVIIRSTLFAFYTYTV